MKPNFRVSVMLDMKSTLSHILETSQRLYIHTYILFLNTLQLTFIKKVIKEVVS